MKVKKILSLVLALAMVFAIAAPAFAVPAEEDVHAHDSSCEAQESVEPRVAVLPCCGATEYDAVPRWDVKHDKCGFCSYRHAGCNDNYATKYHGKKCTACGTVLYVKYTESGYYCPTIGNYNFTK